MTATALLPPVPRGHAIQKILTDTKVVRGMVRYLCYCGAKAECSLEDWAKGISSCSCTGVEMRFPRKDRIGRKVGRLMVKKWLGVDRRSRQLWECECSCGGHLKATELALSTRKVKDCGCVAAAARLKAAQKAQREAQKAAAAMARVIAKRRAEEARSEVQKAKEARAQQKEQEAKARELRAQQEQEKLAKKSELVRMRVEKTRLRIQEEAARRQAFLAEREAEAAAFRAVRLNQYRQMLVEKANAEAEAIERARQQRAALEQKAAAMKTIFELTPAAHRREPSTTAERFKRVSLTAVRQGKTEVVYRCLCGNERTCSLAEWDAGVSKCKCHRRHSPLPFYDLSGLVVGKLTLEGWLGSEQNGKGRVVHTYQARCECGEACAVTSTLLARDALMMCSACSNRQIRGWKADPKHVAMPVMERVELQGARFGKVTVEARTEEASANIWTYRCECGSRGQAKSIELMSGETRECLACERDAARAEGASEEEAQTRAVLGQLRRPEQVRTAELPRSVEYRCFCGKKARVPRADWGAVVNACRCTGKTIRLPSHDLTGVRVGMLVVERWAGRGSLGLVWRCRCDCGTEMVALEEQLLSREKVHCGCLSPRHVKVERVKAPKVPKSAGRAVQPPVEGATEVFGRLRLLGTDPSDGAKALCRCECGHYVRVGLIHLRAGSVTSCGCHPQPTGRPGRRPTVEILMARPELAVAS